MRCPFGYAVNIDNQPKTVAALHCNVKGQSHRCKLVNTAIPSHGCAIDLRGMTISPGDSYIGILPTLDGYSIMLPYLVLLLLCFPLCQLYHIDGLVQGRRNPSAVAKEIPLSCTNPLTCEYDSAGMLEMQTEIIEIISLTVIRRLRYHSWQII